MNYRKISLNQGGLKGAEIFYIEKNDKGIGELTKKYPRNPTHVGLQKLFKDLRLHLLNICGIINPDMDPNIAAQHLTETTVDCIEMDGDTITITGEKLATADKYIKLKTYKLEAEDGYEYYDEVFNLMTAICEETTEYMSGNKKVSNIEILQMYAQATHKEEEFTMEKLMHLPQDQLEKLALVVIEKGKGGIVLMPEDVEADSEEMKGAIEELKTEFAVTDDAVEIPLGEVKVKKEKKVKEVAPVQEESNEEQF